MSHIPHAVKSRSLVVRGLSSQSALLIHEASHKHIQHQHDPLRGDAQYALLPLYIFSPYRAQHNPSRQSESIDIGIRNCSDRGIRLMAGTWHITCLQQSINWLISAVIVKHVCFTVKSHDPAPSPAGRSGLRRVPSTKAPLRQGATAVQSMSRGRYRLQPIHHSPAPRPQKRPSSSLAVTHK